MVAQRWSGAIYEHPSARLAGIHGIVYPARHNHTRHAVAIFNRSDLPRLEIIRTRSWYAEDGEGRSTLSAVLNLYGFSLLETVSHPERKKPGTAGTPQGNLFEE